MQVFCFPTSFNSFLPLGWSRGILVRPEMAKKIGAAPSPVLEDTKMDQDKNGLFAGLAVHGDFLIFIRKGISDALNITRKKILTCSKNKTKVTPAKWSF